MKTTMDKTRLGTTLMDEQYDVGADRKRANVFISPIFTILREKSEIIKAVSVYKSYISIIA